MYFRCSPIYTYFHLHSIRIASDYLEPLHDDHERVFFFFFRKLTFFLQTISMSMTDYTYACTYKIISHVRSNSRKERKKVILIFFFCFALFHHTTGSVIFIVIMRNCTTAGYNCTYKRLCFPYFSNAFPLSPRLYIYAYMEYISLLLYRFYFTAILIHTSHNIRIIHGRNGEALLFFFFFFINFQFNF